MHKRARCADVVLLSNEQHEFEPNVSGTIFITRLLCVFVCV